MIEETVWMPATTSFIEADVVRWTDADSDGITDAGELQSLDAAGITQLSLASTQTSQFVNGNEIIETADFTINGNVQTVGEVLFATNVTNTYYNGDLSSMRSFSNDNCESWYYSTVPYDVRSVA